MLWWMCPPFVRKFSQQCTATDLTFTGTGFHQPCFSRPHPVYFVLSAASSASSWWSFHNCSPSPEEAVCKERHRGTRAEGPSQDGMGLQGDVLLEQPYPGSLSAAALSSCSLKTTWLIFLLWMRTAPPALWFLHGTKTGCMFFTNSSGLSCFLDSVREGRRTHTPYLATLHFNRK